MHFRVPVRWKMPNCGVKARARIWRKIFQIRVGSRCAESEIGSTLYSDKYSPRLSENTLFMKCRNTVSKYKKYRFRCAVLQNLKLDLHYIPTNPRPSPGPTIVRNANIKESTLALSWLSTFIKSQKVEVHYVQANPLGRQDPVIPCLPPSDLICSKILWLNIWKSRYNKFKTEHTKSQKNISAKMFLIFFLTDYIDYNLSSIYPKIYPTISNGNFGARMYTTIFPKFGWKTMKLKPCGEHGIGFLKKKIWFHYRLRS